MDSSATRVLHLSTEFCGNRFSSFCVILLTNKQRDSDENITGGGNELNSNELKYHTKLVNAF